MVFTTLFDGISGLLGQGSCGAYQRKADPYQQQGF